MNSFGHINLDIFESIPRSLLAYIKKVMGENYDGCVIRNAFDIHPMQTMKALNTSFKEGSEITGLCPDEILTAIDFQLNDLSKARIESLLGELRSIHFLKNFGFSEITPIQASRGIKTPDFSANFKTVPFYIEVATLISTSERATPEGCVEWAKMKLINKGKLEQLSAPEGEYKKLFIMVINSIGLQIFENKESYLMILKEIKEGIDYPDDLFCGILTGRNSNGIEDDCIYPPLSTLEV